MKDWLKGKLDQGVDALRSHVRNRADIERLAGLAPAEALRGLEAHVSAMDERGYDAFRTSLRILVGDAVLEAGYSGRTAGLDQAAARLAGGGVSAADAPAFASRAAALAFLLEESERIRDGRPRPSPPVEAGAASLDPEPGPVPEAMDDPAKAMRFMALQQRHMAAMMKILPGTATPAVVEELLDLHGAYEALLRQGPPGFAFYTVADVRRQMADALHKAAQALDSLRDEEGALRCYRRASTAFVEAGLPGEAAKIDATVAQITRHRAGDYDAEVQRLQARLDVVPAKTFEHAQALLELGELHMRGGDDVAARRYVEEARSVLHDDLGHPDPVDQDTAAVLARSIQGILSGGGGGGATPIETLVAVRGAYQRIYQCLMQIHEAADELDEAAEYAGRLERLSAGDLDPAALQRLVRGFGTLGADPGAPRRGGGIGDVRG